ncbi:uncharacterized protein [Typha latifolia]|uniref:uncharacterized protein n=1 Tax=Typha latifolia TaxID=4733 RepID=UPI003C2BBF4D
MVYPRNEGSEKDGSLGGDGSEDSREFIGPGSSGPSSSRGGSCDSFNERLRDESDGDLSLDRNHGDSMVIQWLRALDLQVIGGCRADERLKPLLKLNVSSGAAEDRFMEQLSQHFEVAEIGMLARCLCIPLVSIRVGRINKLGNLLCPTAIRGHLKLTILPSSNLRISFAGDDGFAERLSEINNNFEHPEVIIEEITSDSSGRSFLFKLPGHRVFYFWCSEKSKDHGMELLMKMKDILSRRPTLSNLTGISESRLCSFAKNLHTYLGSLNGGEAKLTASANESLNFELHDSGSCSRPMDSKSLGVNLLAPNTGKAHPVHQASLGPRLSTFKDGTLRTPSSPRSGSGQKHRQPEEGHLSSLTINSQPVASTVCSPTALSNSEHEDDGPRDSGFCGSDFGLPTLSCLPCSPPSFNPLTVHNSLPVVTMESPPFKPYYCWCPPYPSSLRTAVTVSPLPSSSLESLSIPSLSSLLLGAEPPVSAMSSELTFDSEIPLLDLPAFLHDPLVHLSLPISPFVVPGSPQIPTFTPFMSDPIVHVPVIDVCSSGQAYLVSAGPTISSAIPPFLPGLAKPLFAETESVTEKNARETLKWLMASAPTTNPELMSMLPAVFDNVNESLHCTDVDKLDFSRTRNFGIDAIASGISPMYLCCSKQRVADEDESFGINNQEEHEDSIDGNSVPIHDVSEEHQMG